MWERGLKQPEVFRRTIRGHVAPHVGAWIETSLLYEIKKFIKVAPHVGAWIETARR